MNYLMSGVPAEALPQLVANAARVMNDGGCFMVHDFMVDDDRQGPALAALWQLQHLAFTPDALSVTPGYVVSLMTAAGFSDIKEAVMIKGMTRLVWGVKP